MHSIFNNKIEYTRNMLNLKWVKPFYSIYEKLSIFKNNNPITTKIYGTFNSSKESINVVHKRLCKYLEFEEFDGKEHMFHLVIS